jgi:predicted permease
MPEWRDEIRRRLAGHGLRPEREAEIVEEVAQHLEDRYHERLSGGTPADEAVAAAWRELEASDVLGREIARVERSPGPAVPVGSPGGGSLVASLVQDARFALRRLRKRPVFALTSILTVALSVGPATAIVGVADTLFFRQPSGVVAPDRLFLMQFGRPARNGGYSPWFVSYANVSDVLAGAKNYTEMAGEQPMPAGVASGTSDPQRLQGQSVTTNFFQVAGARFSAGRGFLTEEDGTPGGVTSVVIADSLAHRLFGSADAAIRQTVQLNSVPFTVVGVTAPGFEGVGDTGDEFWITGYAYRRARHFAEQRWGYEVNQGPFNTYVVRRAPGASVESAAAELSARIAALADSGQDGAELFKTINMRMLPGLGAPRSTNTSGVDIVRQLAIIATVLVLLGIANMANLLIFEGLKLGREVAIRKALGASVARVIQLTLVESLMISLAGAAAGIGVALGIQGLLAGLPVWRNVTMTVPLDWRVLATTAALAVVTGVGFGVGPALISVRGSVLGAMGRGLRTELPRAGRLRQGLAALQLALSLVLLVGALLFLVTLKHLREVDLGFDPSNVTTMQVDLKSHGYDAPRIFSFYSRLLQLVREQPGIDRVAMTYALPIAGASYSSSLYLPGQDPKSAPEILLNYVSSDYFDVMRVPIARGRAFTPGESFAPSQPTTVILSGTAARALFGSTDPIGRTVVEPGRPPREYMVIGVTAETRWLDVTHAPEAVAYEPFFDGLSTIGGTIVARSSRPAGEVTGVIQTAAASIDRSTPLFRDQTMADVIDGRLARQRLFAWILGLLGAIGFTLAAVGLHGLISQMVAERTREFGIRIAIGADRATVVRLVARQAAAVAVVGTIVGLGTAALAARLVEANLFGVTARDPLVYASATGLLLLVVAAAIVSPTRAATRIDPITVLRAE